MVCLGLLLELELGTWTFFTSTSVSILTQLMHECWMRAVIEAKDNKILCATLFVYVYLSLNLVYQVFRNLSAGRRQCTGIRLYPGGFMNVVLSNNKPASVNHEQKHRRWIMALTLQNNPPGMHIVCMWLADAARHVSHRKLSQIRVSPYEAA